jgi:hypothetical protein
MRDESGILFGMSALIALIITSSVVYSLHTLLMKSVENYDSYGSQGGSFREWREFEREKMQIH